MDYIEQGSDEDEDEEEKAAKSQAPASFETADVMVPDLEEGSDSNYAAESEDESMFDSDESEDEEEAISRRLPNNELAQLKSWSGWKEDRDKECEEKLMSGIEDDGDETIQVYQKPRTK